MNMSADDRTTMMNLGKVVLFGVAVMLVLIFITNVFF